MSFYPRKKIKDDSGKRLRIKGDRDQVGCLCGTRGEMHKIETKDEEIISGEQD